MAIASVVTVEGIAKGDHSKAEQQFNQGMQAYIQLEFKQAYQLWKAAEASDHPKATFNLGRMWLLGQVPGSLKDEQQALAYFKKSEVLGYTPAKNYLQVPLGFISEENVDGLQKGSISEPRVANEFLPRQNNDWLKKYPDSAWVIQVFASQDRELLRLMIRDFSIKDEAKILTERINGQLWYKLVYGNYENKQLALNARQSLPERLQKEKPWVRSIASIKKIQQQ